jgi:hypothetical protein
MLIDSKQMHDETFDDKLNVHQVHKTFSITIFNIN